MRDQNKRVFRAKPQAGNCWSEVAFGTENAEIFGCQPFAGGDRPDRVDAPLVARIQLGLGGHDLLATVARYATDLVDPVTSLDELQTIGRATASTSRTAARAIQLFRLGANEWSGPSSDRASV